MHAYFLNKRGRNDRNAVCKVVTLRHFLSSSFGVKVQKRSKENRTPTREREKEREWEREAGDESSHRQPRTKGILTIRRNRMEGREIASGRARLLIRPVREKTFSYDHFLFNVRYCSHSHVTCTPVETIIGGTWWNVLSSICFRCFQTFLYINIHIFWMSFQVVDKKEKKNE